MLIEQLQNAGHHVWNIAFDGDKNLKSRFTYPFFKYIYESTQTHHFFDIYKSMDNYFGYYITPDPLHILKRLRSQILFT